MVDYIVLQRFMMPDGTETEPLEIDEFINKYKDKKWEGGKEFITRCIEARESRGVG